MAEIKRKFHIQFKSIRNRMIFSFLLVFLAVIIFMGTGIYLFTVDMLESRNQRSYEQVLESAENVLADRISIYEGTARGILDNQSVQNTLQMEDDSSGEYMSQVRLNALNPVGRECIYSMEDVIALYLFDNSGKFYYEDPGRSSREAEELIDYEAIQESRWYEQALEAKGQEVFLGYDVISGQPNRMSCVKVINRLNTMEKIGLMVISISRDAMENVIGQFPIQRDIYVLLNEGLVVYQNGYEEETYREELSTILENEDNEYLITEHVCEDPAWSLLHVVRRSDVFADASSVRNIILVIGLLAVAVMILLCVLQARQITRPLEQLKKDIQRVGEGKRSFRHTFGDDEVGVIGREFQNMVTEQLQLKEQVEKEELLRKESQLQLLQSQINPHFLYNTLDTLYWMALGEDAEQSAELTQALSEIFKISLSEGQEFIAVKDEIKFIEDYLYIQNVRFGDKFLVRIKVDEEIREKKILKQIIQPFVENAIYHGLEPKFGKGTLTVTGRKEEGFLVFTVSDDGVGIEDGVDVMKGYAVSNVYQRLKLHYGEKADLTFARRDAGGTTVTIRLPLRRWNRMKIVLIDDEAIVLRGISALIKKQAEYELAGTADNGIDGLKVVLETEPDIVMTDIRMPGMSGLEMINASEKSAEYGLYCVQRV